QVLLIFWFVLFSSVNGGFMKTFGAEALFLAPEYLGNVNALSAAFMGIAIAVFIMSWNITTFILFSRHFSFLAATQFPFLKYCFNNSVIPIVFIIFFLIKGYQYTHYRELIPNIEIFFLALGFFAGMLFVFIMSFLYFFRADKSILKNLQPLFENAKNFVAHLQPEHVPVKASRLIHTEWFLDSFTKVRKCRDVSHYSHHIMEKVFKRHHFAAVISILIAYLFLIMLGFFQDSPAFQLPAAASITIFFAILIGVAGAFSYFFQSWTIPALLVFLLFLNVLYINKWIDPRNKAYGLSYDNPAERPEYTQQSLLELSNPQAVNQDKQNMVTILNKWKEKQGEAKPLMVIIATSGGGTRSATFTINVLQRLDSITGGEIMNKTFLITGASGGMIGATYFRELYRQRMTDPTINLQSHKYVDDIAGDLLNPTFSSFVARDLFAPEQKFSSGKYTYLKDRGYSFELALSNNTRGLLNKRLGDYKADEEQARIPLMFYHNVITRDGKKLMISTQPIRFMMQASLDSSQHLAPDGLDFVSFFEKQDPYNLRLLTALRMNATFPVVLPNVWLPSNPVIDVMDGGLRDNYGVETALRFSLAMKEWIKENTRGVLLIQIRDRMDGGWEHPYESQTLTENAVKPFFLIQYNWYKMMEYSQADMSAYFQSATDFPFSKMVFQYIPKKEEDKAALSFHLTQREKKDIASSIESPLNAEKFRVVTNLLDVKDKLAENKTAE
ncbi:MAG TPA: patatin-like phospholipase family protein, partial [Chitinophagaceae bacterium]